MISYSPKYSEYYRKASLNAIEIPTLLSDAIEITNDILSLWNNIDENIQEVILPIIIDVDAFLSAHLSSIIEHHTNISIHTQYPDQLKILALKARALKLSQNINQ